MQWSRDRPDEASEDGMLLFADTWYPGWKPAWMGTFSLVPCGLCASGNRSAAGEHVVEFYSSPDFSAGARHQ